MQLSFFVISSSKVKKFTSALKLDNFVRTNKFLPSAKIIMKDENNEIKGEMLISDYLKQGKL